MRTPARPVEPVGPLRYVSVSARDDRRGRGWPPSTAIVTGASSGIGREAALLLAEQSCVTLLIGRDGTALDDVAASTGGHRLAVDLTHEAASVTVAARAHELLGDVDLLVCSAGLGYAGPFDAMDPTTLTELVTLNVLSPLTLVRAVLPRMLERGQGRILLVGSVAGALGVRGETAYSASKAALVGFADALRGEVAGRGVGVTLCLPGAVDTPFFARRGAPYLRRFPRPVPARGVAHAMLEAAGRGQAEVWTPRWLALAARIRGAFPTTYRRLAGVFG